MDAQDEALRQLRAASRAPAGTATEQRAAVHAAWQHLRASARAEEAQPPEGAGDARSSSRSRSRSRERHKKKRKRKHDKRDNSDDEAALLDAARAGDAASAAALLARGVRPGARDANRCTALHWAALFGHTDVAELLLQMPHGGRLARKRTTSSRSTPLHYAVTCGHGAVAALLTAAGADEFAADVSGATPVSLGLRALQAAAAQDARLDALQAARDAARGANALASAAWEAATAAGAWQAPHAPAAAAVPAAAQWAAYQAAWPVFEARAAEAPGSLRFADVPWPLLGAWRADGTPDAAAASAPQRGLLLAALPLPARALRDAVREERRRWHPDKWAGRLRTAVAPADAAAVDDVAGLVIRALNALADALSASEAR